MNSPSWISLGSGLAVGCLFSSFALATDQVVSGDLFVEGDGGFGGTIMSVSSSESGSPNVFITKSDSGSPSQHGGALTFENNHGSNLNRGAGVVSGSINFNFSQPTSGLSQLGARIQAIADYPQSSNELSTALVFGTFNSPYYSGTGTLGFNERMRIAGTGNVGIGTSSPAAKLDVVGDLKVSGDLSVGGGLFSSTGDIALNASTTGAVVISGTRQSTSVDSGALVIAGGVGVAGDFTLGGNIVSSSYDDFYISAGGDRILSYSYGLVSVGIPLFAQHLVVEGSFTLASNNTWFPMTLEGDGHLFHFIYYKDSWSGNSATLDFSLLSEPRQYKLPDQSGVIVVGEKSETSLAGALVVADGNGKISQTYLPAKIRVAESGDLSMGQFTAHGGAGVPAP